MSQYKIIASCTGCTFRRHDLVRLLDEFFSNPLSWSLGKERNERGTIQCFIFKDVFIKEIESSFEDQNYREGHVGLLINELKFSSLNHTHGYYTRPRDSGTILGIVSIYIQAHSMKHLLPLHRDNQQLIRQLLLLQFITVGTLAQTGKFVHHAPSPSNFLFKSLQRPVKYGIRFGERDYTVTLPYRIVLVNFEQSYIPDVSAEHEADIILDLLSALVRASVWLEEDLLRQLNDRGENCLDYVLSWNHFVKTNRLSQRSPLERMGTLFDLGWNWIKSANFRAEPKIV